MSTTVIQRLRTEIRRTLWVSASLVCSAACQPAPEAVQIDGDDIGGVVAGLNGPEAGVWVIAETADLPTRFVRIVVTDDAGRYLLPDLPDADYDVWVRGYGLVDSEKQSAAPGTSLDLTAVAAPDDRAAARYYPAGHCSLSCTCRRSRSFRHRRKRQRHLDWNSQPGSMASDAQVGNVHGLSPAG